MQDVDKHLPDFRQLLSLVPFVPDWRIDDLMISFAAPGGSVGPHKDNYDVFLCQGSGHREWRLASSEDAVLPAISDQLSLLQPFEDPAAVIQKDGDVLYLPPGTPHWGIALDASMTYSIGMRAPTLAELRCSFEREFPSAGNPFKQFPDEHKIFYKDPDLDCAESAPGQIAPPAIARCRQLINKSASASDAALATTLGCVVTDLKAWLAPDTPSDSELTDFRKLISAGSQVRVHGMARIAWWIGHAELLVFANGHCQQTSLDQLGLVRRLCAERELHSKLLQGDENERFVCWLVNIGVFDLEYSGA